MVNEENPFMSEKNEQERIRDLEGYKQKLKQELKDELLKEIISELKSESVDPMRGEGTRTQVLDEQTRVPDLPVLRASSKTEGQEVTLTIKVFLKIAAHALKYANKTIPKENWVEVIGLLAGRLDDDDKKLHVEDAYPMGHGNAVYAEIKDYKNFVKAYQDLRTQGLFVCGWYHSHPSYGLFLSDEDMGTQQRYQKLWNSSIALVIDPYQIDGTNFGFNIFRAELKTRKWFPVPYTFSSELDVTAIPDLVDFITPLSTGKTLFMEYDEG